MTQVPPTAEAALCNAQGLVQNAPALLGEPDPVELESYLHPTAHPTTEFTILLYWVFMSSLLTVSPGRAGAKPEPGHRS